VEHKLKGTQIQKQGKWSKLSDIILFFFQQKLRW